MTGRSFLLNWLSQSLKAMLRIALRNSIKLSDCVEVLKATYVEVAREELERNGEAASASKISAMTGVHRKDIARLKASGGRPLEKHNAISRVMVQWQHDKRFLTKSGRPRVLDAEGRSSEFAELVEAANGGNLNAYAVLFEMERIGAIKKRGSSVRLVWRDYAPKVSAEDGLQMLAEDVTDLYQAVEENIAETFETPNLHLKTEFTKVIATALPEVREWFLHKGSDFHKQARKFLSQYDLDMNSELDQQLDVVHVALGSFSLTHGSDISAQQNGGHRES